MDRFTELKVFGFSEFPAPHIIREKGPFRVIADIPQARCQPVNSTTTPHDGLDVFADGCFEPSSGHGGWAFVAYRNVMEIACDFGGLRDSANNEMEVIALLRAATWINSHASGEYAVIWSDSLYAVKGCNSWRHIWRNNGWKKISANTKARNRSIASAELWKAVDLQLSQNPFVSVAWCKGHAGIHGNERADELAEQGRLRRGSANQASTYARE